MRVRKRSQSELAFIVFKSWIPLSREHLTMIGHLGGDLRERERMQNGLTLSLLAPPVSSYRKEAG